MSGLTADAKTLIDRARVETQVHYDFEWSLCCLLILHVMRYHVLHQPGL